MTTRAPEAFALHALLDGCDAEIRLNDVPIAGAHLHRAETSVHVTPWIVDGDNELTIEVREMRRLAIHPMGATAWDPESGAVHALARVVGGFYEDLVPDEARDPRLAELQWGPVDDAARTLPWSATGSFHVGGRPRWAWQDARPLDPIADRARVLEFVAELYAAFTRGDGAAVAAALPTLAGEAVHFGPGSQDFARGFAAELSRTASEPDFAMAPYAPEDVVLRAIANGRVLRVLHAGGGALFRSAPTMESGFRFRLDLAELGGALEIARLG